RILRFLNLAIPLYWNGFQSVFPKCREAKLPDVPVLFLKLAIKILSLFFLGYRFFLGCSFASLAGGFFLRTLFIEQLFCFFQRYFIGPGALGQFYFCFALYYIETPPTCFFNPDFFLGPFVYKLIDF